MKHAINDDPIFYRTVPVVLTAILFLVVVLIGALVRLPYHFTMFKVLRFFRLSGWGRHADWVYEYMKSIDQVACVVGLNGQHDQTISNAAGSIWVVHEFASPWWVVIVKRATDRVKPGHVVESIEPLRPKTNGKKA